MKALSSSVLAACAAAVVLAGCNNAGASSSALGYGGPAAAYPGVRHLGPLPMPFKGAHGFSVHRDRHASWLSPKLKKAGGDRLLFVADSGVDDVYIFAIPSMTLMATLTGFDLPQGMCSDNAGDVWVTNTSTYQIFEYSHAGNLINTLTDPTGLPVGCAWQRSTGNLAVTNIFNFGSSKGAVLIYPGATGRPVSYTDPDLYYYYSPAYDNHGNLYLTGLGSYPNNYVFYLAELPRRATSAHTVSLTGGTIYLPGTLQWNPGAGRLIIGDQECGGDVMEEQSCLYNVSIAGSTATITGTTSLNNSAGTPACDVSQAVRTGERLYGGDIEYSYSDGYGCASGASLASSTYRWLYPAGGNPVKETTNPQSVPGGAAISP